MYLLAGVLLRGLLLAAEEGMVLVASGLLERKEKIPLGLETLGEEKVLLSSGALLVIWCSWNLSFSLDWTGGIGTCASGSCRCTGMLLQQGKFVSTNATDAGVESV